MRARHSAVAGFENSEGWIANPPGSVSHDLEPLTSCPNRSTAASNSADRMYSGQAILRYILVSKTNKMKIAATAATPIHKSWLPLLAASENMPAASSL